MPQVRETQKRAVKQALSQPKAPQTLGDSTIHPTIASHSGLPTAIQSQVTPPLDGAKVRIHLKWANRAPYYYPGEVVEGFIVPPGVRVGVLPLPISKSIPACNKDLFAPCVLQSMTGSGNALILGKCLNERQEIEANCRAQMVHDMR